MAIYAIKHGDESGDRLQQRFKKQFQRTGLAKKLREQGKKVGVLRIRVFRPWPKAAVESVLQNAKRVLVFDQSVSVGIGGILKTHVGRGSSLICLGKYPGEKDFIDAVARVEKSEKDLRLWL